MNTATNGLIFSAYGLQPMGSFYGLLPMGCFRACNQWVFFRAYQSFETQTMTQPYPNVLPYHIFLANPFVAPQDLSNYLSTRVFNCGSVVCLAYWNLQARNVDLLHIINLQFIAVPPPNRRKFAQRKTYTTESLIT